MKRSICFSILFLLSVLTITAQKYQVQITADKGVKVVANHA